MMLQSRKKMNVMATTIAVVAVLGGLVCAAAGNSAAQDGNPGIQRDRFLLLDNRIVERTKNAKLTVGKVQKDKRNPLFAEDKPWEPRFDNLYANVVYDEEEKLYKCWYSPFIVDESTSNTPRKDRVNGGKFRYMGKHTGRRREMGICYAVSRDGIRWEKPNLGIVEFQGNKENNLVWRGPHGAGVFKDLRDPDPKRRYKMFFKGRKISVAFSGDGLHSAFLHNGKGISFSGGQYDFGILCPQICRCQPISPYAYTACKYRIASL